MKDTILHGNALDRIKELPSASVDCIVTSPPYYGLRNYGVDEQIGLEETPEAYIEKLVTLFRECRRVLKSTGTFWLNLGDSYASDNKGSGGPSKKQLSNKGSRYGAKKFIHNMKSKDLMMIPARVALALQADGWYLRSQIIWHKPNAMPESVKDRPTNDYEMVYLLAKSNEYFYDADAIKEKASGLRSGGFSMQTHLARRDTISGGDPSNLKGMSWEMRNKRAVWSINTKPYQDAHFATMPQELADTCIKAGCPKGGIVLDPFGGAGTTAVSAISLKRHYLLIELNAEYIAMAQKRIDYAKIAASQLELFEDTL